MTSKIETGLGDGEIEFNNPTDDMEVGTEDDEPTSNLVPTISTSENPVEDVLSENQILEHININFNLWLALLFSSEFAIYPELL